ncbi:MAG TPA: PAS domain-containing protein [Candidatus Hydromicrobium sp.]
MSDSTSLKFKTGIISEKEIELILDTLPIDVTFIGRDDEVKYFNKLNTRIFKRSPSIIGLKVQNCHPKKSLDRVQQILDDFKAKKRKVAEFWINLNSRLIYIRYFPVYDNMDEYIGCLEVSQDITDIKKIEGEKRLL